VTRPADLHSQTMITLQTLFLYGRVHPPPATAILSLLVGAGGEIHCGYAKPATKMEDAQNHSSKMQIQLQTTITVLLPLIRRAIPINSHKSAL
jgi:hypothetical protein